MLDTSVEKKLNFQIDNLIQLFHENNYSKVLNKVSQLLNQNPKNLQLLTIKAITLVSLKKFKEAIKCYKQCLKYNPNHMDSYFNIGSVYQDINEINSATSSYKKVLEIDPNHFGALFNIAVIYNDQKEYNKAIYYYKKSLKVNPLDVSVYYNLGIIYYKICEYNLAVKYYKSAIHIDPNFNDTYFNLASVFERLEKYESSLKYYILANKKKPKDKKTLSKIRETFKKLNRNNDAIFYFEDALSKSPNCLNLMYNLAVSYRNNHEYDSCAELLKKIVNLKPSHVDAHLHLGQIYILTSSFNSGLEEFKKAIKIDTKFVNSHSIFLFNLNYSPDLNDREIYSYYEKFNKQYCTQFKKKWKPFNKRKIRGKKLKIGSVSPDFKNHSMKGFLEPIMSNHNHDDFEIYAFAELKFEDTASEYYKSLVDHWIPTKNLSDNDLVAKIREIQIDILVDLAGHTDGNRLGVFAQKPAPVSVSYWLGYAYTTGVKAIDFFLSSPVMVPEGYDHLFSEKVWRMKGNNAPWIPKSNMGPVSKLPAIKNKYVTFGSITRGIRLNDKVIKIWSQILKKVPNSKLIINSEDFKSSVFKNIIAKKFRFFGVDEKNLNFFFESPPWNTLRKIDIALDCFPHNSGTTLMEHLYMGNPVITMADRPSVGRVGNHYLNGINHLEWVAKNDYEYIEKSILLATDLFKLSKIRTTLRSEMETSYIKNPRRFTAQLEQTYKDMWNNYCNKK